LTVLLSSVSFDDGEALQTPSTPQNKALNWLKGNVFLDEYSDKQKIQCYFLATFYYSTNGDTWTEKASWLSNSIDECSWWSDAGETRFCLSDGAVKDFDLFENNMVGSIPPEIALLSGSLGENVPTLSLRPFPLSSLIHCLLSCCFHSTEQLSLHNNKLTGGIPSEICLLTRLGEFYQRFRVSFQRTCSLVSFCASTPLSHCTDWVYLPNNDLTGIIPTEIGLLTNLGTFSHVCPWLLIQTGRCSFGSFTCSPLAFHRALVVVRQQLFG
jgi:hypothetical protein